MKLAKTLARDGRYPPVRIVVTPLDGGKQVNLDRFTAYTFSNSIIAPVASFSFEFRLPDGKGKRVTDVASDGDIVTLYSGNDVDSPICTGIVDSLGLSIDAKNGERGSIVGRNLLAQLEDNESVSIEAKMIFGLKMTIDQVMQWLLKSTRISPNFFSQDGPTDSFLFMANPGESKLQSLLRYLEPLNCLVWMFPSGRVCIGKPNFQQPSLGTFFCNRFNSPVGSNCLSFSYSRGSTTIPNAVVAIWTGTQEAQTLKFNKVAVNSAQGPLRLYRAGHHVIKTIVCSIPDTSSQGLTEVSRLNSESGFLNSYAKQMIASENRRELDVTITVPGHYNDDGQPFDIDQVYNIVCDRAPLDRLMYVYAVDYTLSQAEGQRTTLHLCNLHTIVADTLASTSATIDAGDLGAGLQ